MEQSLTSKDLQDFALNFDKKVTNPLVNAGYDKYNVFNILNIRRQELRHSDFLSFLFDPSKSGNLGQQFLKNFLILLAKENKASTLNFFDTLYGNINNVNVYREMAIQNGRIDILIQLELTKDKKQKVVIAIENKVDSDQHDNQLERYKDYLLKEYKDYIKIMLYLTPRKVKSGYDEWAEIDYGFILDVLKRLDTNNIDNTLATLIDDYKKLIRSEFEMNDNESKLKKAALEIYEQNRQILDFIFDNKPDWLRDASKIFCELLEQKGAKIVFENKDEVLVESKKKDPVNIMFTVSQIENYNDYYFQIDVDKLSLYLVKILKNNRYEKRLLEHFAGNSQETEKKIKEYKANVDCHALRIDCEKIIERIFEKEKGAISKALETLKVV